MGRRVPEITFRTRRDGRWVHVPDTVSDADSVLACVAPDRKVAEDVALRTREGCPHCARAKALARRKTRRCVSVRD